MNDVFDVVDPKRLLFIDSGVNKEPYKKGKQVTEDFDMLGTELDVVARKLPFHDLGISVEGLVPERFHHLTKADFEKLKYKWKLYDVPTLFDFTVEVD